MMVIAVVVRCSLTVGWRGSGQGRLSLRGESSSSRTADHRLSVVGLTVISIAAASITGGLRVGGVDDCVPVLVHRSRDRVHGSDVVNVDVVVGGGGRGEVGTGKINAGGNAFNIVGSVVVGKLLLGEVVVRTVVVTGWLQMLVPEDQVFQHVGVKVIETRDQLHLVPSAAATAPSNQVRLHRAHAGLLLLLLQQEMDPVTIFSCRNEVASLVLRLSGASPKDQQDEADQQEEKCRRCNDGEEIEITRGGTAAPSRLGRRVTVLLSFLLIHIYRGKGKKRENVFQINIFLLSLLRRDAAGFVSAAHLVQCMCMHDARCLGMRMRGDESQSGREEKTKIQISDFSPSSDSTSKGTRRGRGRGEAGSS